MSSKRRDRQLSKDNAGPSKRSEDGEASTSKPTSSRDDSSTYEGVLDSKRDKALILALKHIDTFYKPPPGMDGVVDERPEDCIPDKPENAAARDFLAKAPKKGLWMPLGKEVKVMQCWRCKAYGHRTGDKECPMYLSGNKESEQFRFAHEDPMINFINENRKEKQEKVKQLMKLVDASSTEDSASDSSTSDEASSSSRKRKRKNKKKDKKGRKKRKNEKDDKKKKKERDH